MHSRKMRLTGVLLMLAAFAAVACTKEVVKEVEVPGETIIVEKEVVKEVPVEVVVEKEVVKEIVVEKIIEVEKIVEVEVEAMAKQTYQEAPMLAQLVAAGILDPVEERIPVNPWVLPVEEIGLYGGTLTRAYFCPTDIWNFLRLSRAPIARFTTDGSGSVPSVVAGWEVSNEGRTWTFELRKGMRWSDGMPATMEDVKFAWEDVITNTDLLETPPPLLSLEDIAPEFKVIDELHWSLTFHKPNYVFLQAIPQTGFDWQRMLLPKHYLKQFHADYADAATLQAIVDGGPNLDGNQVKWTHKTEWDDWKDAFRHHFHGYMEDTQMPRLHPWILKTRYGVQRMIAERNAYFYGVDPAGNQLPYIDRIVWECVENADVVQLKAVAGELTLQGRHVQMETYPLLQENRNKGGYTVKLWPEFRRDEHRRLPELQLEGPRGRVLQHGGVPPGPLRGGGPRPDERGQLPGHRNAQNADATPGPWGVPGLRVGAEVDRVQP